jgi:hypothetical protein
MSSHSNFRDIHRDWTPESTKPDEGMKTDAVARRIQSEGGLVSPLIWMGDNICCGRGVASGAGQPVRPYPFCSSDCGRTAQSWAHGYLHVTKELNFESVGLATDMPWAGAPEKRAGCSTATSGLNYINYDQYIRNPGSIPTELGGLANIGPNPPLIPCRSGDRTWDYNTDGFCHVGLLPDFLQDVRNVWIRNEEMAPLFHSAEAYIKMWEKCIQRASEIPREHHAF